MVKHESRTETELFAEGKHPELEAKLAVPTALCPLHCARLHRRAGFKHLHVFVDSAEIMCNLWTNQLVGFSGGVQPDLLHMLLISHHVQSPTENSTTDQTECVLIRLDLKSQY